MMGDLFCLYSASVLDRLNPLMEPGGMLNLDERGVVDDGIISVTPHPDFRQAIFVMTSGVSQLTSCLLSTV